MFYLSINQDFATRYDFSKFCEFVEGAYDSVESYFLQELAKLPAYGYYQVVGESGRPDLLSYRIYGSTQYWWILLFYNNLLSIDDIENNMNIRYPSLDDIEILYFQLNSKAAQQG